MAIEIAPKKESQLKKLNNPVVYIGIVVFLVIGIIYFGLSLLKGQKEEELEKAKEQLTAERTPEMRELERDLERKAEKIDLFGEVISDRRSSTEVLKIIEGLTLPKVMWESLDMQYEDSIVSLPGKADNFLTLTHQYLALKLNPSVKKFDLTGIQLGGGSEGEDVGGGVTFDLKLHLKESDYKFK